MSLVSASKLNNVWVFRGHALSLCLWTTLLPYNILSLPKEFKQQWRLRQRKRNITLKGTFASRYIFRDYCFLLSLSIADKLGFQLQVISRNLRCLLLLWLVGVITLVLVFRLSFETCSIRQVIFIMDILSLNSQRVGCTNFFQSNCCLILIKLDLLLTFTISKVCEVAVKFAMWSMIVSNKSCDTNNNTQSEKIKDNASNLLKYRILLPGIFTESVAREPRSSWS